jgi:hypothetical protein
MCDGMWYLSDPKGGALEEYLVNEEHTEGWRRWWRCGAWGAGEGDVWRSSRGLSLLFCESCVRKAGLVW